MYESCLRSEGQPRKSFNWSLVSPQNFKEVKEDKNGFYLKFDLVIPIFARIFQIYRHLTSVCVPFNAHKESDAD